ncbi:hypothetical protein CTAYLR_009163 [Chrysophaeum taylorii]|uniref:EF-hand domain-containing protein n=1 Tax=Chrysophaeum taylorii TaxID=2483200 RepID=A0AAD7UIH5_9STRA|nr:hypothetical protein CTAYLR_009163 [Chrysophaeum taylorii]
MPSSETVEETKAAEEARTKQSKKACWSVLKIMAFYGSGCLVFGYGPERWEVSRTLYFLTVTVTTVGYGDVVPQNPTSQGVAIIYIFAGLIIIFPIIADAATFILNKQEARVEKFARRFRVFGPASLKIAYSVLLIVLNMIIGMTFFGLQETQEGDWSRLDAVWWTLATVTTIGYGDLAFKHGDRSRWFLTVYIPVSVIMVGAALANLAHAREEIKAAERERQLLARFDMNLIKELDTNGDGLDKAEYVLGMLQAMELVDKDKVQLYEEQFDEYDVDHSGKLTQEDLDLIELRIKQKKQKQKQKHHGGHP